MYLAQEILQQPSVIARLITQARPHIAQIAQHIRDFAPSFITVAARGTSDNAARYAQYLLGGRAGLYVGLNTPSLHTLYQTPPNLGRALVIGISQSGQAEDVRRVLSDAKGQGALTLAITNNPNSPLAHEAHHHIDLMAEEEMSIAATKTYTAQLCVIALLGAELCDDPAMRAELDALPALVTQTLTLCESIPTWAERYRYMTQFVALGRGYNYPTAIEISLKVKELSAITGDGYSEADFRHGPIAIASAGVPIIAVAPQGKTDGQMLDLLEKLHQRQTELLVISNMPQALALATKPMPIPDVAEWLSPLLAILPGQVFAMHQAIVRGLPVDSPRGLSKVTVTE